MVDSKMFNSSKFWFVEAIGYPALFDYLFYASTGAQSSQGRAGRTQRRCQ